MKRFILNYKLQVLAVGVLALAQVSALSLSPQDIQRHVAQEVASGETAAAVTSGTVTGIAVSDNDRDRERQILNAYKRYQDKSKECLIKVRDDDSMKSLFRDYRLDSSSENLDAIARKLEDMGLLSISTSTSSGSSFRDEFLGLESDDRDSSSSSSSAVLDPDKSSDLKEIARCHERRIKDLDSQEEKRAYFKNIEHKFADMLAESDSKEISELAREFQKTARTADPNNTLGLQTVAQMHSEYALLLANGMAEIRLLEKQLALNPTDQLLQSRLQLAKTNLDTQFTQIQTRYMAQVNHQNPNALEHLTAIQTVTSGWQQNKTNMLAGTQIGSFANNVNANGLVGDPIINNPITGISTLPSTTNLLTLPDNSSSIASGNLMTVRTGQGRLNMNNYDPSIFGNMANKIPNSGRMVPSLGLAPQQ